MEIYLAATGAELLHLASYQGSLAYMACHFSSSGRGISGLPDSLPNGSMLMLTDEFPVHDHDPEQIACELLQGATTLSCGHILLDFQRADEPKTTQIASAILNKATIPVGISAQYAEHFQCPVLVSPSPLWTPLAEQLAPWSGREIWLEAVLENASVIVTEEGSRYIAGDHPREAPHFCEELSVSYSSCATSSGVEFHLHRGKQELAHLLDRAKQAGVSTAIGLYQQLGK